MREGHHPTDRAGAQRCVFVDGDGTRCSNFGSCQSDAGLLCNQHKGRGRVEAVGAVVGGGEWTCSACTLINTGGATVCEVCGTGR